MFEEELEKRREGEKMVFLSEVIRFPEIYKRYYNNKGELKIKTTCLSCIENILKYLDSLAYKCMYSIDEGILTIRSYNFLTQKGNISNLNDDEEIYILIKLLAKRLEAEAIRSGEIKINSDKYEYVFLKDSAF